MCPVLLERITVCCSLICSSVKVTAAFGFLFARTLVYPLILDYIMMEFVVIILLSITRLLS